MLSPISTRLPAVLAALTLASVLTGCTTLAPSADVPVDLPAIPSSLTACSRPATLPTAALTQADVERYWARDRVALVKCGANLSAVDRFYADLRTRLNTARK